MIAGFGSDRPIPAEDMSVRATLSIVVPAYNEAANILGTLDNISSAVARLGLNAEILVVDDGSADRTAALVTANASRFPGTRLLINERNLGFGATYRRGVAAAEGAYIVMVHGDNAWGADTLRDLFSRVGEADIVIGYTRDMWQSRTFTRTVISKTFTMLVNAITRRGLHYYNGLQIHRADVLKTMTIQSSGFGFQPEVLVKALRQSRTLIEVPMDLREREHGDSKAFRWKNAVDVYHTLRRLRAICAEPR
jgi:glycosyltransferase involved in cell wall biosynthesis